MTACHLLQIIAFWYMITSHMQNNVFEPIDVEMLRPSKFVCQISYVLLDQPK